MDKSRDKSTITNKKKGVLKNTNRRKESESDIDNTYEPKPRKKVRIDESEGIRVKQQLAKKSGVHFSAKDLPAKIIKSKSNKNLFEEVKVASPLKHLRSQIPKNELEQLTDGRHEKDKNQLDTSVDMVQDLSSSENSSQIMSDNEEQKNLKFRLNKAPIFNEEDIIISEESLEESDCEKYQADKDYTRKEIIKGKSIIMPKEDQLILIKRMQEYVPDNDHKSYKYRLKHLEWHKVAFKNYTIDHCKQIWRELFKKVRHYRLLQEITSDIKEIIELNDLEAIKTKQTKKNIMKHPDMPKKPMSPYFLYYTKNRDKLAKERPDLKALDLSKYISETYHQLSLKEKRKYNLMAAKMRNKYKLELAEFYAEHPSLMNIKKVYRKKIRMQSEKPPKRSENSFKLFMQAQCKDKKSDDIADFKEVCLKKWNQLPDSKKLHWINKAEEEYTKYRKNLSDYMARHPKFTPNKSMMTYLSKKEVLLKEKIIGKPKKPPINAFGLFKSIILSSAGNILSEERWSYCYSKWNALSEDEKDEYSKLLKEKQEQYEKDFKIYLDTLPEDKREEEIAKNIPKRRKLIASKIKKKTTYK